MLSSPQLLTLLSLSSSALSHSKSLYRLRTDDSFSLKMGRLVCGQTHKGTYTRLQPLLLKCCLVCCSVFSLSPRSGYTNWRERRENQDMTETVCACLFLSSVVYERAAAIFLFSLLSDLAIIILINCLRSIKKCLSQFKKANANVFWWLVLSDWHSKTQIHLINIHRKKCSKSSHLSDKQQKMFETIKSTDSFFCSLTNQWT